MAVYGSKCGCFVDHRPPHSEFEGSKPSKGTYINRNTTFEPSSVQIGPKLRPVNWPRKRKKGRKRKSQNRYISPPRGSAILQTICTKFGEFVDLNDVITPAKICIGFSRPRGGKHLHPLESKQPM